MLLETQVNNKKIFVDLDNNYSYKLYVYEGDLVWSDQFTNIDDLNHKLRELDVNFSVSNNYSVATINQWYAISDDVIVVSFSYRDKDIASTVKLTNDAKNNAAIVAKLINEWESTYNMEVPFYVVARAWNVFTKQRQEGNK